MRENRDEIIVHRGHIQQKWLVCKLEQESNNSNPCLPSQSLNFRQCGWKIVFFVRDHILRYFFTSKAKGRTCPASESTWLWFRHVNQSWGEGNRQASFVGITLHFTLRLQLNHATDIIWPLFLCTLVWCLDYCISSLLYDHVYEKTLRSFMIRLIEAWQP